MEREKLFPHLKDTDAVRREAAAQYGGLGDAAALVQAHKASQDPNTEAAALRRINVEETAKVAADLSLAQERIDDEFGEGTFAVIDAAVRGDALSTIVEDADGRTHHKVVGWNDRWRSIARKDPDAARNAEAEATAAKLGASAQAEIARRVAEAAAEIRKEVTAQVEQVIASLRGKQAEDAEVDDGEDDGEPVSGEGQSPSGGNLAGEGDPGQEPDGGEPEVHYPRTHDDLDGIAQKAGFAWPDGTKSVEAKVAALKAAEIKPE